MRIHWRFEGKCEISDKGPKTKWFSFYIVILLEANLLYKTVWQPINSKARFSKILRKRKHIKIHIAFNIKFFLFYSILMIMLFMYFFKWKAFYYFFNWIIIIHVDDDCIFYVILEIIHPCFVLSSIYAF